jgi:hypothetical protein
LGFGHEHAWNARFPCHSAKIDVLLLLGEGVAMSDTGQLPCFDNQKGAPFMNELLAGASTRLRQARSGGLFVRRSVHEKRLNYARTANSVADLGLPLGAAVVKSSRRT